MRKSILTTLILTLGVLLATTKKTNASCPTSVDIVGDSIVFTYSGGVPDWTVLKKIRYYTSVGSGTSYTTSVAGTNATSTTITVPKPPAVDSSVTITEIMLRVPNVSAGFIWNHICTFNALLPVDFISFEGVNNNGLVKLSWATAMEKNNQYFEILKSYDGDAFFTIGHVNGAGNSSEILNYTYSDTETKTAYYRLQQIDFDGMFEYSDVIAVKGSSREVESVKYYTLTGTEVSTARGSLIITRYVDGSYTKTMTR